MNISILISIIGSLASVASIFSALAAARSARAAEQSARREAGAYDLSAFQHLLLDEFLERRFRATHAPEINGRKVELLREAKSIAKKEYERDPEEWDRLSRCSNLGAWQNAVAFETAWALNHLGASVFTGMFPLRLIFALVAEVVVDDWLLCRSWVKSYREEQGLVLLKPDVHGPAVHCHRRHGEWLALIGAVWTSQHWAYPNCDRLAEWYGGKDKLPAAIQALVRADGELMPQFVRDEVKALVGVDVSH